LAYLHPGGTDAIAFEAMFLRAPVAPMNRLLEIGCGNGYLLERMQKFSWRVEGLELDPACIEILQQKRIPCHIGDLRDQSFPSESFDVVFMSHVIEHVYDPAGFVTECFRVLKPGGQLIALTPNAASFGHRFFGCDWRGLEPPRHIQIFNQRNLAAAFRNAGFSEVYSRTTNRGAWYLYGTSSAIRSARKARLPQTQWQARILSLRGLLSQLIGRALVSVRSDLGEENILFAKKSR
jgi:2-polyprenyl-3-methyl-5-hydroxy-6-metoxy-1,4-benzoquinol methylase